MQLTARFAALPYENESHYFILFESAVTQFTTDGTRRQHLLYSKRKTTLLVNLPATCSSDNFLSCFCGKRFGLHKILQNVQVKP